MTSCNFLLAWQGPCGKPTTEPDRKYCTEHDGIKCVNCGAQATKQCDETVGPCVCGCYLCDNCEHEIAPDGTNGSTFKHVEKGAQKFKIWCDQTPHEQLVGEYFMLQRNIACRESMAQHFSQAIASWNAKTERLRDQAADMVLVHPQLQGLTEKNYLKLDLVRLKEDLLQGEYTRNRLKFTKRVAKYRQAYIDTMCCLAENMIKGSPNVNEIREHASKQLADAQAMEDCINMLYPPITEEHTIYASTMAHIRGKLHMTQVREDTLVALTGKCATDWWGDSNSEYHAIDARTNLYHWTLIDQALLVKNVVYAYTHGTIHDKTYLLRMDKV